MKPEFRQTGRVWHIVFCPHCLEEMEDDYVYDGQDEVHVYFCGNEECLDHDPTDAIVRQIMVNDDHKYLDGPTQDEWIFA